MTQEQSENSQRVTIRDLFIAMVVFALWATFCFCSGLGIRLAIIGGRAAATLIAGEPGAAFATPEVLSTVVVVARPSATTKPADIATPKPTATATFTPVPPTQTFTSTPEPTPTPSPTLTASPSPEPSATATATRRPSPTATQSPTPRRSPTVAHSPTRRPTSTATPTFTATPSPTPKSYPAPKLLAPPSGVSFSDVATQIYLRWESVGELAEDEWYDVQIWRVGEEPRGAIWLKETEWLLDTKYHGNIILWRVGVIRGAEGEVQRNLSPYSGTGQFNWHL